MLRAPHEACDRLSLGELRFRERLTRVAAQDAGLCLAKAMPAVEQQVDVAPMVARETVERPRRDGRLADLVDLVGVVGAAVGLQLLRKPLSLRDELLRRGV